jgi:His-Xaa-Ser system radical SAM maturase HxsC
MLPLHGFATLVEGTKPSGRSVLRLRDAANSRSSDRDIAVVKSAAEADTARESGYRSALAFAQAGNAIGDFSELRITLPDQFSYLGDGDVIGIDLTRRRFRTLYRRASKHNSFLVTERCNHYCLMCSQPPKDIDDSWIFDEIRHAVPLLSPETRFLGFTGGEPFLDWRRFIPLVELCRDKLPHTGIHVLSNGRAFCSSHVVDAWAGLHHPDLTVGIPVYSCVDSVHDYVVQARGAFDETILGILKLKDRGQRVEIRVVLHSVTAPLISETARWLARNLPFVDHVALMGLENTGFAIANDELLWIDPVDYQSELADAVEALDAAGLRVSIYNLPKCVLPKTVWPFAAQSISDWKNNFLPECAGCKEQETCSGFFTTGRPRYSRAIKPFTN